MRLLFSIPHFRPFQSVIVISVRFDGSFSSVAVNKSCYHK